MVARLQAALPREHYVDPAQWQRERERVLLRSWWCAGRTDVLGVAAAGRLAVIDVLGESILLARTRDGRLRAHYNVCRHRGAELVPADPAVPRPAPANATAIRCPYHSWTYDLDGCLLRAPHTDGLDDFDPADFGLHPVGAQEWGGFVFVNLSPESGPSLQDELGPVPDRVRRYPLPELGVGHRLTYDVRANWKVIAENYNECYHCGPVHPELSRLVPSFAGGGDGLDWDAGIPHREGAWTFTTTGTTSRRPFAGLDDDERVRHKGELVYPNLFLSLSAEHVAAFLLQPLAVDRTRVVCELLFAPEEIASPAFDPSDAADLWDLVNRQDWAICESVQRGMSSRAYTDGWFAPMEDLSLDIRRWLLPRLGDVQ